MPKLIPYRAPTLPGLGAGGGAAPGVGAMFAAAGRMRGERERRDRSRDAWVGFAQQAIGIGGNLLGGYLRDKRQVERDALNDQRDLAKTRQKLDLEAQADEAKKAADRQNRALFIRQVEESDPDLVSHPKWQRYRAAIEGDLLDPKDAFTLINSEEFKDKAAEQGNARLGLQKSAQDSLIDYRGKVFGLQRERLDETKANNLRVDADRDANRERLGTNGPKNGIDPKQEKHLKQRVRTALRTLSNLEDDLQTTPDDETLQRLYQQAQGRVEAFEKDLENFYASPSPAAAQPRPTPDQIQRAAPDMRGEERTQRDFSDPYAEQTPTASAVQTTTASPFGTDVQAQIRMWNSLGMSRDQIKEELRKRGLGS